MSLAVFIIAGFFILCFTTPTSAQQIRDFSLPPSESLQQPNITNAPNGAGGIGATGYNNYMRQNNLGNNTGAAPARYADTPDTAYPTADATGNRFMDSFCAPNTAPTAGQGRFAVSMQNCIQQQKQQSCQTFAILPADVQRVIDQTVSCLYTAMNGDGDTVSTAPALDDCTAFDTKRLLLLKKYWRDANSSQALVFMPDEVIAAPNRCVQGRY